MVKAPAIFENVPGGSQTWYLAASLGSIIILILLSLEGFFLLQNGQTEAGITTFGVGVIAGLMFFAFQFVRIRAKGPTGTAGQKMYIALGVSDDQAHSISFFIGLLGWMYLLSTQSLTQLSTITQYVPQLELSAVFSTATANLDKPASYAAHGFAFPYIEEGFFLAALPLLTIRFMDSLGIKNKLLRLGIIIGVSGSLFASFHVGQTALAGFWVAAFTVRAIWLFLLQGDIDYDIIPGFAVLFTFIIGAHMGNNIMVLTEATTPIAALIEWFTVMSGNTVVFAAISAVFLLWGVWAVSGVLNLLNVEAWGGPFKQLASLGRK